jgi:hypothetical protein
LVAVGDEGWVDGRVAEVHGSLCGLCSLVGGSVGGVLWFVCVCV